MTSLTQRQSLVSLINEAVTAGARQAQACDVVGLSPRTLQRWKTDLEQGDQRSQRIQHPRNRFNEIERQRILAVMNSEDYGHLPPSQIVPRLADQGLYVASESTMYRLLRRVGQLRYRGRERAPRAKPRALAATVSRQLFSWDITYLPSDIKGRFFYLYLFLDVFSRKVVGWQVYDTEDSDRASDLLHDICQRENIRADQVVLHSDNGAPMKGATMLATMQQLGVVPSFSRPAVSDDNPYSEALFRTLKYRPHYPRRLFKDLHHARAWMQGFVRWYNTEHRHSAIRFVTPEQRHNGQDKALLARRHEVYEAARARHPQRWSGAVRSWARIDVVHLNPEKGHAVSEMSETTLKRVA